MTQEKWRQFSKVDREEFAAFLADVLEKCPPELGLENGKFEGDPIGLLLEGVVFGFVTLFFAQRQQQEEHANRPPYVSKLGDLLQKFVWSLQSGIMMKEDTIDLDGITFKITGSRLDKGDRLFEFKITIKEKTNG